MDRNNDRDGASMDGPEGLVIASVHFDNAIGVLIQLLDVDASAEASPFGANDQDAGLFSATDLLNLLRERQPLGAVQGIYGGLIDH
jgi:hypothetical protein